MKLKSYTTILYDNIDTHVYHLSISCVIWLSIEIMHVCLKHHSYFIKLKEYVTFDVLRYVKIEEQHENSQKWPLKTPFELEWNHGTNVWH